MNALLDVHDLKISIRTDEGTASVLDHISFELPHGKILGVAGESGCGKSTLVKAILGILPANAVIESGDIRLEGRTLLPERGSRRNNAGEIGFIPQDPYTSLNPVFKIGDQLSEILRWSGLPAGVASGASRSQRKSAERDYLVGMLRAVRLPDPEDALERYPHQFSGGQRQRILIAAALAPRPRLIVADEPTTALDVTTQRDILILLKELVDQFNASMLFVTHDFGVVAEICDRLTIIYAGQTVESGLTGDLLRRPSHPYSRRLLACHPDFADEFVGIPGQVPSPYAAPPGCRFNPRCLVARPVCSTTRPPLMFAGADKLGSACFFPEAPKVMERSWG